MLYRGETDKISLKGTAKGREDEDIGRKQRRDGRRRYFTYRRKGFPLKERKEDMGTW